MINNLSTKCTGKLTRQKVTKKRHEQSIIDFVIGCEEIAEMITELIIDENKQCALESFRKTKTGTKVIKSDHNSIITQIKTVWNKKMPKTRHEMYNLKDKEGLLTFKEIHPKDTFLSDVFEKGPGELPTAQRYRIKISKYMCK